MTSRNWQPLTFVQALSDILSPGSASFDRHAVRLVSRRVVCGEILAGQGSQDSRCGRVELCLTLLCPHHNDFCIKMGSDESHFNVSFTVRAKISEH